MRWWKFVRRAWPVAAMLYAAGVTLIVVLPVTLLAGVGIAVFDILWTTALAERIPPASLSRVSSFDWMVSGALLPLEFTVEGALRHIGLPTAVSVNGAESYVAAARLGLGLIQARALIGRLKPAAVIGFGGYPTIPPVLAAAWRGVPSLIHEANAVPGRANRLLAPRVRAIATGFPDGFRAEASLAAKATLTGTYQ